MPLSHVHRSTITALLGLIAALVMASSAAAVPVVITDPATGAEVTLDPGAAVPGGRIQITGSGFQREGGGGHPWIAVMPDDDPDATGWTYGGANAIAGDPAEAPIWFEATDDGRFSGWIDLPADLSPQAAAGGRHWFRILGGAFSSDGSSATRPITFQAPFDVLQRVQIGALGPTGVFQRGTHYQPGAPVTLRGTGLPASTSVSALLDGDAIGSFSTTADGGIAESPAVAVTLPADVSVGEHELRFEATGDVLASTSITIHPPAAATVANPHVRPGGLVDVAVSGFVGVGGDGQKAAVTIGSGGDETTVACIQTDAEGAGRATVHVPEGLTGDQPIRFPAGAKCQRSGDPGFAVDDLPARPPIGALAHVLTVDDQAPSLVVAGAPDADGRPQVARGGALQLTGTGFPAGTALAATLDDAPIGGPLTAGPEGGLAGSLPLAADVPLGVHRLSVTGGGQGAVVEIAVVAPTPADPDPGTGGGTPDPGDGGGAPGSGTGGAPAPGTGGTPNPGAGGAPDPGAGQQPGTGTTPPAVRARFSGAKVRGSRLRLKLIGTGGRKVAISVRSRARVRLRAKGRKAYVTLVKRTTTKRTGTISLKLTADGRRALKRLRKLRVVVTLAPAGGKTVKRTVTLKA